MITATVLAAVVLAFAVAQAGRLLRNLLTIRPAERSTEAS